MFSHDFQSTTYHSKRTLVFHAFLCEIESTQPLQRLFLFFSSRLQQSLTIRQNRKEHKAVIKRINVIAIQTIPKDESLFRFIVGFYSNHFTVPIAAAVR